MNKITIAAIAAAALTTYLVARRRSWSSVSNDSMEPAMKQFGNPEKHLTNVFSKAKKYSM